MSDTKTPPKPDDVLRRMLATKPHPSKKASPAKEPQAAVKRATKSLAGK